MSPVISNDAIIKFLKENYESTGFIDGLKIKYRSLICPFISLLEMIKPGDKVADIGCGSGQFLLLAKHFAIPDYVYGIEISERLINNANKLFKKYEEKTYHFETYDGQHFPEALKEMDIFFLIDVLHHVPKVQQTNFITNLIKCMKPGARLVLKDINAASLLVYCNKMHDIIFAGEIGNEISFAKAKEIMDDNQLTILEEYKRTMYVYPHYCILAKK